MENGNWCPMSFGNPPYPSGEWSNCLREACAWWNYHHDACAVAVIAAMLVRGDLRAEREADRWPKRG